MKNKIFTIIIAFQIALLGLIGASTIGLNIPILRPMVGFLYLLFIPGTLLLIILKINNLDIIEWIIYSVGLSISFVMFVGFCMNFLYPYIGISNPISSISVVITLTFLTTILLTMAYFRDKNQPNIICTFDVKTFKCNQVLSLCLIPIISIFGTYLLNYYNNNILLIILILLLSTIPLIVAYKKLHRNLYPFALFVIAISLLLHYSLVSGYLNGYDVHIEYFFGQKVLTNYYWDYTIYSNVNSMLSIVILGPFLSIITGINLIWVFKLLYPLIFALSVIALFKIYQEQTSDEIAFFSVFFFMSVFTFFIGMPQLARQEIAEIYYILLILIFVNQKLDGRNNAILSIIFIFSLIVSHYGLSYIFLFTIIVVSIIIYFFPSHRKISSNIVALSLVVLMSWYIYTSSSSNLYSIVNLVQMSTEKLLSDFGNLDYVQGLETVALTVSPARQITKILHIISQILITIRICTILLGKSNVKIDRTFVVFSSVAYLITIFSLTIPYFSNAMNTMRIYHITLISLAPFFVIGGINLLHAVVKVLKINIDRHSRHSSIIISVFLSIFIIFNSGLIYEIAQDEPNYISFNNSIDAPRFNEQEVLTAMWLKDKKDINTKVYSDEYRGLLLLGILGEWNIFNIFNIFNIDLITDKPDHVYIFLGKKNVKEGKLIVHTFGRGKDSKNIKNLQLNEKLLGMSTIRSDGSTIVYYR